MNKNLDILVIDDEQVIIDAIERIMSAEGFAVDSSLSAVEGLKKLDDNSYKLIITDIMMPEMDGFQFLDELEERKIQIPVIITTGYSTVEMAVKSLQKGAIGYIPKPFTVEEIISIVYRGLAYRKIIQELKNNVNYQSDASIIYVPCPPKYSRLGNNSWIRIDNEGSVFVGVTDLYLKTINSLIEIEMMNFEENIIQGSTCAKFKTENELVHNLLAPVSGLIIEQNKKLIDDCCLIEKDPYFQGWLYRIIPSHLDEEINNLITCSSDRI